MRVLVGKPRMHRDFVLDRTAREIVIGGTAEIAISFDGEACTMPLRLTLRSRPKALAVVHPPQPNA